MTPKQRLQRLRKLSKSTKAHTVDAMPVLDEHVFLMLDESRRDGWSGFVLSWEVIVEEDVTMASADFFMTRSRYDLDTGHCFRNPPPEDPPPPRPTRRGQGPPTPALSP